MTTVANMLEWSQRLVRMNLMPHVAADTLSIDVDVHKGAVMTSCRKNVKRICRRNACTSHADSCRIVVWQQYSAAN